MLAFVAFLFTIPFQILHDYLVEGGILLLAALTLARMVARELKSLRKEWKEPDD